MYAIVSRRASPPSSSRTRAADADRARGGGPDAPTTRSAARAGDVIKPNRPPGKQGRRGDREYSNGSRSRPADGRSPAPPVGWLRPTSPTAVSTAGCTPSARAGSALAFCSSSRIVVYVLSNPHRHDFYDHFVWQAQAWLDGRAGIPYPVEDGIRANAYFQDVLDLGDASLTAASGCRSSPARAHPLPAPAGRAAAAVRGAVSGLATSGALVAAVPGRASTSASAGGCSRASPTGATRRSWAPSSTASARSPGTRPCWARPGSWPTWWPPRSCSWPSPRPSTPSGAKRVEGAGRAIAGRLPDARRLGRAAVRHGLPGPPDDDLRRAVLRVRGRRRHVAAPAVAAGLGALIPLLILLGYNLATTGHVFHPAYEYLRGTSTGRRRSSATPTGASRTRATSWSERAHHAALAARQSPPGATTPPAHRRPASSTSCSNPDCPARSGPTRWA